jgi:metal-responsive CopG/Arc/MetJ family transcriptional regulator
MANKAKLVITLPDKIKDLFDEESRKRGHSKSLLIEKFIRTWLKLECNKDIEE